MVVTDGRDFGLPVGQFDLIINLLLLDGLVG